MTLAKDGAGQADMPEPGRRIALELPGLDRTVRRRGVDEEVDVRIDPIDLGESTGQDKRLRHVEDGRGRVVC